MTRIFIEQKKYDHIVWFNISTNEGVVQSEEKMYWHIEKVMTSYYLNSFHVLFLFIERQC